MSKVFVVKCFLLKCNGFARNAGLWAEGFKENNSYIKVVFAHHNFYLCKNYFLQRLFAIILLFCLHAQPAVNISVWIDFIANNDYIKEVLCINKERPKLQCDGKCYLMQQLQEKKSEQEQELPQLIHAKYEFVILSYYQYDIKHTIPYLRTDNFSIKKEHYSLLKTWDIFHPPQV